VLPNFYDTTCLRHTNILLLIKYKTKEKDLAFSSLWGDMYGMSSIHFFYFEGEGKQLPFDKRYTNISSMFSLNFLFKFDFFSHN
jgi:hypothetical protein